jgi:hypothetical protein
MIIVKYTMFILCLGMCIHVEPQLYREWHGCSPLLIIIISPCLLVWYNYMLYSQRALKTLTAYINIQGGPRVGIQYIVYKLLYAYFWPTLYVFIWCDEVVFYFCQDFRVGVMILIKKVVCNC